MGYSTLFSSPVLLRRRSKRVAGRTPGNSACSAATAASLLIWVLQGWIASLSYSYHYRCNNSMHFSLSRSWHQGTTALAPNSSLIVVVFYYLSSVLTLLVKKWFILTIKFRSWKITFTFWHFRSSISSFCSRGN